MSLNFNFVQELVKSEELQVAHISRDKIADDFTKSSPLSRFLEIKSKLDVRTLF